MKDWFLNNQIWIALILGAVCLGVALLTTPLYDSSQIRILTGYVASTILIGIGGKLFEDDSSENWLEVSYPILLKNAIGGVLMFIGWVVMLRAVVGQAIGSALLKMG